jgi:hypothetical protein
MNRSPQSPGTSTYLDHVEPSPGGRFAEAARRERLAKPQIVGTEPSARYPHLPASSPWAGPDLVGVEPPLGVEINALEPVGEPHEVAASLGEVVAPPSVASAEVVETTSPNPEHQSIRRRL